MFRELADIVLVMHFAFVVFILIGELLIVVGGFRGWHWVRNPWLRWAHLLAISLVVVESWAKITCPLTDLEDALRANAGEASYGDTFMAYWLHCVLFVDAPQWVFTLGYSLFGSAVIVTWLWLRPCPFRGNKN